MLTHLHIENFAIIDKLQLEFAKGLVVFTGETGAGKSIILDALDVVLGGKAEPTMVRSGTERAIVEGEFMIDGMNRQELLTLLEQEELLEDTNYITISREIRKEGRTSTRVNGRSVSAGILKDLAGFLVDIHGQTEHLSIFNTKTHIELLDRFANLAAEKTAFLTLYTEYNKIHRELAAIREAQANASNRQDMLTFQVEEIRKAALKPGEDVANKQERDRLANAESLSKLVAQAAELLDEGGYENPSIIDQLGNLITVLHSLSRLDSTLQSMQEQGESVMETLSDLSHDLRIYGEGIEFNPQRLELLENRIDLANQLCRKYGGSIEAVLQYEQKATAELDDITNGDDRIIQLETEQARVLAQLTELGAALTLARTTAATTLAEKVEQELDDLKMASAKFQIQIQPSEAVDGQPNGGLTKTGFDKVEFLIAPNLGEGFKPLVKIASGGETSRLMLALKNTLAREDNIPTLVFDEIDQGIGGRVGNIVGEKLKNLSKNHQVFCITHLPQLAAFGDQHFKVEKALDHDRTTTKVSTLAEEERVQELAQMFGELTEGTVTSARELLSMVRKNAE